MSETDPVRQRKARPIAAGPGLRTRGRVLRWLGRGVAWGLGVVAGLMLLLVVLFSFVNPPTNLYQMRESARLGGVQRDWVGIDAIAPAMARAAVAAEDANFCNHWGFDMAAIRAAIDAGSTRGASTITQQTVKNVFLWQDRSWLRKAMEAALTPVVELLWSKERVLEVYLNVAEFGEGIFGVQAAARHYFGVDAADLSALQAARLAAVLPDPKDRNPARPGPVTRARTGQIMAGAETIAADGRAGCFGG